MDQLAETLGMDPDLLKKLAGSALVIIGLVLIRALVLRWLQRQVEVAEGQYRARKVATYAATVLAAVSLAFIWVDAFDSLPTYLGLVSAGVAIALSDLLKNMAGWAYLLIRRPFRVGDRVEIKGIKGDVIDIRLFRFTVMEVGNWVEAEQSTGRLVHIPNGLVFSDAVANYTEGFPYIWDEMPVLVTFESDHDKAEEIIRRAMTEMAPDLEAMAGASIRETALRYQIRMGTLTPTVYLSVRDSGILLTARYLVHTRQRRGVHSAIWRSILEGFNAEPTVALAYPTVRTYLQGPIHVMGPTDG